ncbi:hypothetical protein BGX34_001971 [Mortierella sp. NVP85]|nr:hypothetical protein BGX34_001971 [Mortierella sp. NVP85]
MESPFTSLPLIPTITTPSLSRTPGSQTKSSFMLPELDRLIASYLDHTTLTNAARVSKLWHSVFNPVLWKKLSLQHVPSDDDYDEDFNFISRATPPSPTPSLPSSCSSTWSSLSMTAIHPTSGSLSSSMSSSPVSTFDALPKLSLFQQAFVHASRNKVLKGLVRHGHLVQELKATGVTDQEMDLIGLLCPSLRVLELVGGRYTAENLTDLFQRRSESLQIVRFRSCVLLKDIFLPMRHLPHLQEFELYGSFVGNTITSPYFFERDLFPMLQACPKLRSVLIEQVYIIDQHVDQGRWDGDGGGGSNGNDTISNQASPSPRAQSMATLTPMSNVSVTQSGVTSILSAQLRAAVPFVRPAPSLTKSSLKSLILDCGDISESVIMALLARCPLLEQLSLDWSRNLTDESLVTLQRICPYLTEISLCRCEGITEDGFKSLFRGYPNLTSIQLNGNVLSDSVLEELARSCRFLRDLSIISCQNVTDLGIQAVLLNCAYLSSFSLRSVPGLSCLLFDDITMTPALGLGENGSSFLTTSSSLLSSSPGSSLSRLFAEMSSPSGPRPWACRDTLEALHLPDLTQPNRMLLNRWQYQQSPLQSSQSSEHRSTTPGDGLIQSRLQHLKRLKHLTIGGNNIDVRVVLDGLESARELETLRITKLKRTLTLDDAQWLVEEAAPNLKRLAVPVFGNRAAIEWLEDQWPDLLSYEK